MRWMKSYLLGAIFGGASAAALYVDFTTRSEGHDLSSDLPRTAIVFTGQFDRIRMGLELLSTDRVDTLFITGVNRKAGLDVARFARQFRLTPEQTDALSTGRIVLAADANSTLENALETECWLKRHPDIEAVTLITSRSHMARASLALKRTVAPVRVTRLVSDPMRDAGTFRTRTTEFRDFLATWAITLLPRSLWPVNQPANCGPPPEGSPFTSSDS